MKFCWMLLGLLGLAIPGKVRAQSLAQVVQQLVLDYQKLAELKNILADMYKGYTIVSTGYENIRMIAQGNFNLHAAFLDGLLLVSPSVQDYYKIRRIIGNEEALVREYRSASRYFSANGHFSSGELDYLNSLYGNLLNGSLRDISELTMVVTAGELRMSDAERLAAIDRIDRDVGDKLNFLRTFNNNGAIQAGQRAIDGNDLSVLQQLYGIGK